MSISSAVEQLVKELNKEIDRMTKLRDTLLATGPGEASQAILSAASKSTPVKKRAYTKRAVSAKAVKTKKAVPVKKTAPTVKKRVMSAETKKRISEAHKKRAAAKKPGAAE